MQLRRWIILTAAALFGPVVTFAAAPSTQPTTAPTTEPAVDADGDDVNMKVIVWPTISTAIKLSLKDHMLVMSTDLPAIDDPARVKIADFAGKTVVVVKHEAPIITVRHDISVPPNTTIIYSLSAMGNDVRLSVDSEDGKELRSVQYIQSITNEVADPTEPPVKLIISVTDMVSGNKSVDLRLAADDVVQLRRKFPRETAQYFQPLLAALRQDEVLFAVDHRTAWQVLQQHFTVDRVTTEKVKLLVKDLDADEYATREVASESLEKLGEPAVLTVLRMDRAGLTSEQNSRLETVLAPYKPLSEADAKRYAGDVWFLIDCLSTEDRPIREAALKQLESLNQRPKDLKINASPSAWRAGVREFRKQMMAATATKPATAPATSESR